MRAGTVHLHPRLFKEKVKKITFIAAYIAVLKGSEIGVELFYAQQMTIHKRHI